MEGSLDRILVESRLMQRRVQRPKERCTSKLRSSFSCFGLAFKHWTPASFEARQLPNPGQRQPMSSAQGGFEQLRLILLERLDRHECLKDHVG